MSRTIYLLCCALIQFVGVAICQGQIEKEVASQIETVTVYPTYALVQRMAELNLDAGEHVLVFSELPGTLVEESIRASVEQQKAVQIADVRVETWFLESPAELDVAQLEKEIKKLEIQDKELENQIVIFKEKIQFLQSIKVSSSSQASDNLQQGKIDTGAWKTTLDFLETNLSVNYQGMLQAKIQRNKIATQLEALKKQHQRAKTATPRQQKTIYVGVSAQKKIETRIRVSYLMHEAAWTPLYEIRAHTESSELELSYFGNIRQKTGENWEDVNLTLSTARPARGAQLPELEPWHLDISWARGGSEALSAKVAPESPRYVIEADEAEAIIPPPSIAEAKGVSVTFQIAGKKQIHSGEDAEKILIMRKNLPVTFNYYTVPKLSPFAYLVSKGKNETEYPLLAGSASIFVGGDYVGKSNPDNIAPNEEFKLSLGVDEGIQVERELVKKFVRRTGLLGKKTEEQLVYKIKITNHKAHQCMITVQDQVPISRNATIEIKEIDIIPEPTKYDMEKGLLQWFAKLEPNEEKIITLGFTVIYPKGNKPDGLF